MNCEDILIIINPHAGLLNPGAAGPGEIGHLAKRLLPGAGLVVTRSEEHAGKEVAAALGRGVRIVAGAGGDGTAHFLAGLLAGKDAALGIIPMGSAGNVARSLGIPGSPRRALRILRGGLLRNLDLGRVNGVHFIEAAGAGLHAELLRRYGLKERKGLFRGIYSLSETLSGFRPFDVELELDGRKVKRRAAQVTVANLPLYGTGFEIAPGAEADDGLLDVTVLGAAAAAGIPAYAGAARLGLLERLPGVERFRAAEIVMKTEKAIAVHADAEPAGETPAKFSVKRGALKVVMPRK